MRIPKIKVYLFSSIDHKIDNPQDFTICGYRWPHIGHFLESMEPMNLLSM